MTPSKVEFTLFGSPQFLVDGERIEGFATRKTQALLMYLVCNRRALSRDLLAGMFWGDKPETDARNNLRRVLPELRRRFGDYLAADRQAIRFDRRASFWLDVDEFTAALAMIRNAPLDESDIDRLEAALALYSGEFLAGFNLPDAPGFEEWVTFQREHLRELALVVDTAGGPALLSPEVRAFFARQPVDGLWQLPPLAIDGTARRVWLDGREIDVSGLEYDLLLLLAARPGSVYTAGEIDAALWPHDAGSAGNGERLKSVVKGLRRRLGAYEHLVQNERGVGYALAVERLDPG